jgi:hypothetical protein
MMSDSLEEIQQPDQAPQQNAGHLFMAYDGDNAGRLVGQAILADDPQSLHEASSRIEHGHEIVRDWVQAQGGQVISGGGDEGTFVIPAQAINDIETLRKDYQYATDLTMTVGVGKSLSEAGKALMVGKFRGKDQVCQYDESIEAELEKAKADIAGGTATDEEKKLGEAYLKPEGEKMNESENTHDDCQYCAEMTENNTPDMDHCKYCHDLPAETDSEPHCQYCAEADQNQVSDHAHTGDDCQYCADANANTAQDHEHSEENCQYCADAAAQPAETHEHTGDNCAYCASAPQAATPESNQTGSSSEMQQIAQQIEAGPSDQESPASIVAGMTGPEDMPGTEMQDGTSHPADYQQDVPGDMGMAEGAPTEGPDLSQVLQTGLDSHAGNIQKERVIQIVSEALEGFKGCKDLLEKAKGQAPQLYSSSIAMLKAMIEMAKLLGLTAKEEQPAQPAPQAAPAQAPMAPAGEQPQGK